MPENAWKIRAVQLDLARQMETVDFIEHFIDFIASYGYNTLLLYLEGRVRTEAFPYPSEAESYSPKDMRRIVAYAAGKGIDVVPAIQAIGHAELFLQHPELAPLWELRDTEGYGRWKGKATRPATFCPTRPATREFLEKYIRDLIAIFPSPYFHAGLDETWHLGVCTLCRAHPGGQEGVFSDMALWLHEVVCQRHGKRLMLWDDMYERYPGALEKTPRDVILCCWQYNMALDATRHHFSTCRENVPEKYRRMGFDFLIAPSEGSFNNIITFTDYAGPNAPLGGLVTAWEKQTSFMLESYPVIAYAGRAWQRPENNGEALARECIAEVFGIRESPFADAVLAAKNLSLPGPFSDTERYLRGPLSAAEINLGQLAAVLRHTLSAYRDAVSGAMAGPVLDDMLARLDAFGLHYAMRQCVPAAYGPDAAPDPATLEALADRAASLGSRRLAQWKRWRPGIDDRSLKAHFSPLEKNLRALVPGVKTGLLTIRCFMPFVAQDSRIRVRYAGEDTWETVAERRLCPLAGEIFYRIDFPVAADKTPAAIRFCTWGYGFQGVAFLSIRNALGRFVPACVSDLWGEVHDPLYVLLDDDTWVMAGARSARESYSDLPGILNQVEHGFEIQVHEACGRPRVTRYSTANLA